MTDYADTADALSVLAHETRLEIVSELAEAAEPLSFTALRERVGVRDTGKFNYHLTALCEYYVRETTEGYKLGHAGERLAEEPGVAAGGGATTDGATGDDENEACPVCTRTARSCSTSTSGRRGADLRR